MQFLWCYSQGFVWQAIHVYNYISIETLKKNRTIIHSRVKTFCISPLHYRLFLSKINHFVLQSLLEFSAHSFSWEWLADIFCAQPQLMLCFGTPVTSVWIMLSQYSVGELYFAVKLCSIICTRVLFRWQLLRKLSVSSCSIVFCCLHNWDVFTC